MTVRRSRVRIAAVAALTVVGLVTAAVAPGASAVRPGSLAAPPGPLTGALGGPTGLGPVQAFTPDAIEMGGVPLTNSLFPSLSGRGETAGITVTGGSSTVTTAPLNTIGSSFVHFDDGDLEPLEAPWLTVVAGNRCEAMQVRPVDPIGGSTFYVVQLIMVDRCTATVRPLGARQTIDLFVHPALSFDGRFAAFMTQQGVIRLDTESEQVRFMPVPGDGGFTDVRPESGIDISDDANTIVVPMAGPDGFEVVAWDLATNTSVQVSAPDGPQGGWSAYPSVSGNGRFVAFATSRARGPGEVSFNGPWVYVVDRSNGAVRLASNPVDGSYESSISADGTQVAYTVGRRPVTVDAVGTTTTTNFLRFRGTTGGCSYFRSDLDDLEFDCPGDHVDVAWSSTPGFAGTPSRQQVSLPEHALPDDGSRFTPVLAGNGRWVAWVAPTAGEPPVRAFRRRRGSGLTVSSVDFGQLAFGTSRTVNSTVRNIGTTTVAIGSVTAAGGGFAVVGSTCGATLPPGGSCTVRVQFTAGSTAGSFAGSLTVAETGFDAVSASGSLAARVADSSTPIPDPEPDPGPDPRPDPTVPALTAAPDPVDYGIVEVGSSTADTDVVVTNVGTGTASSIGTTLTGDHTDDFFVSDNGCVNQDLAPGASCTMRVRFIPLAGGDRTATLTASSGGTTTSVTLRGVGDAAIELVATPNPVDFGLLRVGFDSEPTTVTVTNVGNGPGVLGTVLGGSHPADFFVPTNGCVGVNLQPSASCTMELVFLARDGGDRAAVLTVSSGGVAVDVALRGQARFEPELRVSPGAVTERGIAILLGKGFPANRVYRVDLVDADGVAVGSVDVFADASGLFDAPFSPLGRLPLGNYLARVDALPSIFETVEVPFVVVLPTFQPQGPTGPVFGNNLIVSRT